MLLRQSIAALTSFGLALRKIRCATDGLRRHSRLTRQGFANEVGQKAAVPDPCRESSRNGLCKRRTPRLDRAIRKLRGRSRTDYPRVVAQRLPTESRRLRVSSCKSMRMILNYLPNHYGIADF